MTAHDSIHYIRAKRPGSVQMTKQIEGKAEVSMRIDLFSSDASFSGSGIRRLPHSSTNRLYELVRLLHLNLLLMHSTR